MNSVFSAVFVPKKIGLVKGKYNNKKEKMFSVSWTAENIFPVWYVCNHWPLSFSFALLFSLEGLCCCRQEEPSSPFAFRSHIINSATNRFSGHQIRWFSWWICFFSFFVQLFYFLSIWYCKSNSFSLFAGNTNLGTGDSSFSSPEVLLGSTQSGRLCFVLFQSNFHSINWVSFLFEVLSSLSPFVDGSVFLNWKKKRN